MFPICTSAREDHYIYIYIYIYIYKPTTWCFGYSLMFFILLATMCSHFSLPRRSSPYWVRIAWRFHLLIIVKTFQMVISDLLDTTQQLQEATCCLWTWRRIWPSRSSAFTILRLHAAPISFANYFCPLNNILGMDLFIMRWMAMNWFGWFLWHINNSWLFNAKYCLCIFKYMWQRILKIYAYTGFFLLTFVNEPELILCGPESNELIFCGPESNDFKYCYLTRMILFTVNHLFIHT